ncbi:MAG: response regulator transcription factor [Planctomycetota bacterium]
MSERRPKILVVEDEEHIAEGLLLNLDAEGYLPILRTDGMEALERAKKGGLDLIVLDVMLPRLSGFQICRELRRLGVKTPVLFLTAKGRGDDRVKGLDLGADDYLVKPFRLDELLSRVRAILRRERWHREQPFSNEGTVTIGRATVCFRTAVATVDGEEHRLSPKELSVLRVLVEHRGEAVSRNLILEQCWPSEEPTTRTIDNFILRLRRRVEHDPQRPEHIQTVFGVGYRFLP